MQDNISKTTGILNLAVRLLLVLILLSTCMVVLKYVFNRRNAAKIVELQNIITEMKSTINVDTIRQYNIQKVISIIDQYNLKMPGYQKYEIAEEIFDITHQYTNLNVELICAIITFETGGTWNPRTTSSYGAMGLMQIMPVTGMFISSSEGITWSSPKDVLFNPVYNIRIGARYLAALIDLYDVDGGLAAYYDGLRRAAQWIDHGRMPGALSDQASEYVETIQRLYEEYQKLVL